MKTQLLTILLVLLATMAQAQHKVTGKIVDPQGEAIVGAIVQEENSTRGTVTDLNGNYELTTSSADAALLFSYIGYDTQRILVANKQTLNVTMYA
ncbi:MAG: carboxypeptidase-like regulatory domain-containing protein, partial [Alistipes sp.]|nr:carboxypeptidase-like regulatory domain-containing protein [Alistipes sp.]